jgi:peptidoglycan/LPS O-acetylase OafA/YrhL
MFKDSRSKSLNFITQKMALYSYGIYLIHIPILYLVFVRMPIKNVPLSSFLFVVLTLASSAITYHLIESPLIRLGKTLSSRPRAMSAVLANSEPG